MNKRIGIYGGTFNPIHNGHLIAAQNALEQFALDTVLFVPSNISYLKNNVTKSIHRVKMTELAISNNPAFLLSTVEIERGGNSYTYQTLEKLSQLYPNDELFFIVGADSFDYIDTWKCPDVIFKKASLIVAKREGFDESSLDSTKNMLTAKYNAKIYMLSERHFDISSSEIRNRVKNGLIIDYFVPQCVKDYIITNNLYKGDN